ncbi:MAG TPA: nickel-dependent lactate racemase [Clostridia bacterium]|nr:nickel-dependent lactate racemase [Clostridia bacterium]
MLIKGVVKLEAIKMKCGRREVSIQPRTEGFLGLIQSGGMDNMKPENEIVLEALDNPIGSRKLRDIVSPGEKVCIIISDITRAWQKMSFYLPYIVDELNEAGIEDEYITFLCATGSHRPQTWEEHKLLLGEKLSSRFEVTEHDCRKEESLVKLGTTSFGTPVIVNKIAVESDHVILTGAIVFHDLAGWGGGKKSILPGISAYESIMANHALSMKPGSGEGLNSSVRCGSVLENPVHMDMLEAAAFVKPSFLFNVILDEQGNIGKAVAGDYIMAHDAGCRMVDETDSVYIAEEADSIVVSAGGYPKDINLYQASKALINSKEAVKEGGVIILLAECIEGFGGNEVQLMLEDYSDNCSREKALREGFTVEKYTGYLIAEIAERYNVIMVTSMNPRLLKNSGITVVGSVQEAQAVAQMLQAGSTTVYYMPYGANTLPRLSVSENKNGLNIHKK